jgi:hypothetical protein
MRLVELMITGGVKESRYTTVHLEEAQAAVETISREFSAHQ